MERNKIIQRYIRNKIVLDIGFLGENKKVFNNLIVVVKNENNLFIKLGFWS